MPVLAVARHEAATGIVSAELRRTGRPHVLANLALAMTSAAIAAALFLLVLLLIEGWRLTPIGAAVVVSVMPLAALVGARLGPAAGSDRARAAAGAILVSGGLGGLALLPKAEIALTLPPQLLVGVGLSLVLSALTETALSGRAPQAIHGGWTISARHAGVALGLLALTPLFTADIAEQRHDAIDSGTAVVLDSAVDPLLKLELSQRIDDRLEGEKGRVPTIGPAFEPLPEDPEDRAEVLQLRGELQDQLDRGATHAFSPSFGLGAADRPAGPAADRPRPESRAVSTASATSASNRGTVLVLVAVVASLALVGAYFAAGGSSYAPAQVQDPCEPRDWRDPQGIEEIAEQFSLSALDGAACELGVTREALARALATPRAAGAVHPALRDRGRRAGQGGSGRAAAGGRRRRTSWSAQPAAGRAAARGAAPDSPRPGDRTDPRRPHPPRPGPDLPRAGPGAIGTVPAHKGHAR